MQLPRHPEFTTQLLYEISAQNYRETFIRILAWSCLLSDSIIFHRAKQPEKTTKLQNELKTHSNFQTEKSFNRQRTAKPEKAE